MNNKKYDIVAIGNAIVDVLEQVEDEFLINNQLKKGSMKLVNKSEMQNLCQKGFNKMRSGGSNANAIAISAKLDSKTAFIGKIGCDFDGEIFETDMKSNNIDCHLIKSKEGSTAKSIVMISADGQRTMATFLGAAGKLKKDEIDTDMIRNCKILYVEGYLWDTDHTISFLKAAIIEAKKSHAKVAFTLSDIFCVERHKAEFLKLIKNDLDIVFANYDEACMLFDVKKLNDLKNSIIGITKQKPNLIFALTRSEKGAIIFHGNEVIEVKTKKINPIDTTGAGDAFSGAFLSYLEKGFDLKACAEIGNKMAGKIISQMGARLQEV